MTSKFGSDLFINRHLGLGDNDERIMLNKLGFNNIEQFINQVIPEDIQLQDKSSKILPQGCSEIEALNELEEIANCLVGSEMCIRDSNKGTSCH